MGKYLDGFRNWAKELSSKCYVVALVRNGNEVPDEFVCKVSLLSDGLDTGIEKFVGANSREDLICYSLPYTKRGARKRLRRMRIANDLDPDAEYPEPIRKYKNNYWVSDHIYAMA